MMKKQLTLTVATLLTGASLVMTTGISHAGGNHAGGHGHGAAASDDMDMGSMNMENMDMSTMKKLPVDASDAPGGHGAHGGHAGHGGHGGHAHDYWETPPASYANRVFDEWDSFERAKNGMGLYRDNCASCHGIDGRGTGPLAKSLKHPPADLTNHFHNKPGDGDQYLFWRVTEGGQVEPFKSADSAMPEFEASLTETQRWNVLAYIHQAFHRGFKQDGMMSGAGMHHGGGHGKGKGHH